MHEHKKQCAFSSKSVYFEYKNEFKRTHQTRKHLQITMRKITKFAMCANHGDHPEQFIA